MAKNGSQISGVRSMKLKSLLKYILFPTYRHNFKIANYLRRGYTAQEALAKAKVIEA
jgi:hypothetical protein